MARQLVPVGGPLLPAHAFLELVEEVAGDGHLDAIAREDERFRVRRALAVRARGRDRDVRDLRRDEMRDVGEVQRRLDAERLREEEEQGHLLLVLRYVFHVF